jgi:hypothetical protein
LPPAWPKPKGGRPVVPDRAYLEFPVKSLDDFEEMKARFDARSPERFRADPAWPQKCAP